MPSLGWSLAWLSVVPLLWVIRNILVDRRDLRAEQEAQHRAYRAQMASPGLWAPHVYSDTATDEEWARAVEELEQQP